MDRIEEVKELMRLAHIEAEVAEQAKVDEVTTEFPDRQIIEIGPASEPIFEEYAQQIDQLYQPKADEGRLLICKECPSWRDCEGSNQEDCTRRDEEGLFSPEEQVRYIEFPVEGYTTDRVGLCKAQRDLTSGLKDAECQKRVEGIFAEIDSCRKGCGGFGSLTFRLNYETLKQKEGL